MIGDISRIREENTLGRKNNQPFHAFPYRTIYQMLGYKLALCGISLNMQDESYSSQCAPTSKRVDKGHPAKYKRCKRGLFKDNGTIYNADAVGAYNILRLYLHKTGREAAGFRDLITVSKVTV